MNNYHISKLPTHEWEKIRNNYYISNHGMDRTNARQALFLFDKIINSLNIKYFLSFGTALGIHREGDFIEWDDEIDVDIFSEDGVHRLNDIEEAFLKNGFIVRTTPRGLSTKMSVFINKIKIAIGFIYKEKGYRNYHYYKIPEKFYENSQKIIFCEKEFNLPGPIDEYLTYLYGDWKTPIKSYDPNDYLNKKEDLKK